MTKLEWTVAATLDEVRPILEATSHEAGLVLDFLMQRWNGRFATYNLGTPTNTIEDGRRGVRDEARTYRLLGRLKATHTPDGLRLTLSPPTACDLTPNEAEQVTWERFVERLHTALAC